MAEETKSEVQEQAESAAPAAPKAPGIMKLVKVVAIISVVVVLQVIAASAMIPSAEETVAIGEKLLAAEDAEASKSEEEATDEPKEAEEAVKIVEVALGSYHVVTFDPATGASINIDFDLYGTVLEEESSEFYQLYTANQRRLEEQVVVTMRGTELTDLSDAGLGLIKRKILEKTNRALGKPLLREVVFPNFSFLER